MDSGRLLPLTADGRIINLAHSFVHTQQSPQNPGILRKESQKSRSSIRIARASSAEQFPKNVKIRHHTYSAFFAKGLSVGRGKVARVEGA
jgi:hypothetical protein